jgi:hypothetical protein
MPIFWLALIIALVLTVASAIYVTLKGLQAFRDVKRLSRVGGGEIERISGTSGEIERHLALAAESGSQLEASLARLRSSLARLNVLTSAIEDVRATVRRVTAVMPHK